MKTGLVAVCVIDFQVTAAAGRCLQHVACHVFDGNITAAGGLNIQVLHWILPASMSPLLEVVRVTSLFVFSGLASVMSEELEVANAVTSGAKTFTSHSYFPLMESDSPLGKL